MKKRRWGWKFVALLMVACAILAILRPHRASPLGNVIVDLAIVLCTLGLFQHGFGRPQLPRSLWRIFGPIVSLFVIGSSASSLGWLGTRLAIRPLTFSEQATTVAIMVVILSFALMLVFPLLRLGEWEARLLSKPVDRGHLRELEQTFN